MEVIVMKEKNGAETANEETKEVKGDIDDLIFDEFSSKNCSER